MSFPYASASIQKRELLDLYPQPRGREAAVEYETGPPGLARRNGAT